MEKSNGNEDGVDKILRYDMSLNYYIGETFRLFNQINKMKTYSLSEIDSFLMKVIEDAQNIKQKYNLKIKKYNWDFHRIF